ncbi:MAG: thioesterase domain-containing protein [Caldilineaceae bacterium]
MMEQTMERIRRLPPERKIWVLQQAQLLGNHPIRRIWSPLVPLQPNAGSPPIYFIHPMGCALFFYLPMLNHLGSHYNIVGIQGHGLYEGQQALDSIPEMASIYINAIRERQPQGPYHLVGYSMGGLIAFEMAQQLQQTAKPVGLLALLDSYVFTKRIPFPGKEIKDADERLLMRLSRTLDDGQVRKLYRLLQPIRSNQERIAHVIEIAKATGKIPSNYGVDDLRRMFNSYDAHLNAVENFRPQPYSDRAFFFQCTDTSDTQSIPSIPWNRLVPNGLMHYRVVGKHSTVMNEPYVQGLAHYLRMAMQQVGIE